MSKLNVVLITQGMSRVVLPLFQSDINIVAVVESASRRFSKNYFIQRCYYKIIYVLYLIFKPQKNLKVYCKSKGIDYLLHQKGKESELISFLRDRKVDLIVVYSMSQLLTKEVLNLPTQGAINLHPSFLPEYRGPNPDFWHYYDMKPYAGISVHYISRGEDTGDLIYSDKVDIPFGIKSDERLDVVVSQHGLKLLIKAIADIENGTVVRVRQSKESPTVRARNIEVNEHGMLVDWENWPTLRIWHLLRGTYTWLFPYKNTSLFFRHAFVWEPVRYYQLDCTNEKHPQVGVITKINGDYCVRTRQDIIILNRKFSLKKFIAWLTIK